MSENKKNPKRPCPFCGKFFSRLTKHLIAIHKEEEKVKEASKLPKDLRDKVFGGLKNDGIKKYNMELLKEKTVTPSALIKGRQSRDEEQECAMCSGCGKFLIKRNIYKHKMRCASLSSNTGTIEAISTNILSKTDQQFSESYRKSVLESFQKDNVGNQIQEDEWIKTYGYYHFQNQNERSPTFWAKRRNVMQKMRRLTRLFILFKNVSATKNLSVTPESSLDMFKRDNIPILLEAINQLAEDEEKEHGMRHGLKIQLRYLINDACQKLSAHYLIRKEDDKYEELQKFEKLIKTLWQSFFASAEEQALLNRNTDLRKPQRLPEKDDIVKLKDTTVDVINSVCQKGYDILETKDYNLLRNAVVSRLTLHNARRGGEPCRMTIKEWDDAMQDVWVDKYRGEHIKDPISQNLICKYKIAYVKASKLLKLVAVLIPEDCWEAMKILSDPGVRSNVGINSKNEFVFANTQNSLSYVVGWQCVRQMGKTAQLLKPICATDVRHFVATNYALQDVSREQRNIMYKHFGHSELMNENVYQCPEGLREIINVGGYLSQIDETYGN